MLFMLAVILRQQPSKVQTAFVLYNVFTILFVVRIHLELTHSDTIGEALAGLCVQYIGQPGGLSRRNGSNGWKNTGSIPGKGCAMPMRTPPFMRKCFVSLQDRRQKSRPDPRSFYRMELAARVRDRMQLEEFGQKARSQWKKPDLAIFEIFTGKKYKSVLGYENVLYYRHYNSRNTVLTF